MQINLQEQSACALHSYCGVCFHLLSLSESLTCGPLLTRGSWAALQDDTLPKFLVCRLLLQNAVLIVVFDCLSHQALPLTKHCPSAVRQDTLSLLGFTRRTGCKVSRSSEERVGGNPEEAGDFAVPCDPYRKATAPGRPLILLLITEIRIMAAAPA